MAVVAITTFAGCFQGAPVSSFSFPAPEAGSIVAFHYQMTDDPVLQSYERTILASGRTQVYAPTWQVTTALIFDSWWSDYSDGRSPTGPSRVVLDATDFDTLYTAYTCGAGSTAPCDESVVFVSPKEMGPDQPAFHFLAGAWGLQLSVGSEERRLVGETEIAIRGIGSEATPGGKAARLWIGPADEATTQTLGYATALWTNGEAWPSEFSFFPGDDSRGQRPFVGTRLPAVAPTTEPVPETELPEIRSYLEREVWSGAFAPGFIGSFPNLRLPSAEAWEAARGNETVARWIEEHPDFHARDARLVQLDAPSATPTIFTDGAELLLSEPTGNHLRVVVERDTFWSPALGFTSVETRVSETVPSEGTARGELPRNQTWANFSKFSALLCELAFACDHIWLAQYFSGGEGRLHVQIAWENPDYEEAAEGAQFQSCCYVLSSLDDLNIKQAEMAKSQIRPLLGTSWPE